MSGSAIAADGIFINDGVDDSCVAIADQVNPVSGPSVSSTNCGVGDKDTQIDRALFFATQNTGSNSLTLGGELYVNSGHLVLSDMATGTKSMEIGNAATSATGFESIAIGNGTKAVDWNTVAMGTAAKADKQFSTALGAESQANGISSTAVGSRANAEATRSIVIGESSTVVGGDNAIAVGYRTKANAIDSIGIGNRNTIDGLGSAVIGNDNVIAAGDVFALGNNITTTIGNSVVLGSRSAATGAQTATSAGMAPYSSSTANGKTYNYAAGTPVGVVSVGSEGAERRVQNVAAGLVTATSTDAINGSQLNATQAAIEKQLDEGVVKYDRNPDGTVNPDSVTLQGTPYDPATKEGGTTITNVAPGEDPSDAVNKGQLDDEVAGLTEAGLNFSGNDATAGTVHRNLGQTLTIRGDASAPRDSYSGMNVKTVTDPATGTIHIQFAESPKFGNVIINDAGSGKITGVENGLVEKDSKEAVNGGQLYEIQQKANAGWMLSANGEATGHNIAPGAFANFADGTNTQVTRTDNTITYSVVENPTFAGEVTANGGLTVGGDTKVDMGGNLITNVADGVAPTDAVNVGQLDGKGAELTTAGMNFAGNDGTVHRDLGQVLTIKGDAGTAGTYSGANVKTVTDPATGTIHIQIADAPKFGNVTINDGGSGKITGVENGNVAEGSKEAVNGGQLYEIQQKAGAGWMLSANGEATGQNIAPGAAANFANGTNTQVTRTDNTITVSVVDNPTFAGEVTANGGLTVGAATTVDMGGNVVTNVGPGAINSTSTDAINGSQLLGVSKSIVEHLGGNSAVNVDGSLGGPVYNVQGNEYTTVYDALEGIDNALTNAEGGMFQVSQEGPVEKPKTTGTNSAAGGNGAVASGNNALAVGNQSSATGEGSTAVGNGATASHANSVAIGADSATTVGAQTGYNAAYVGPTTSTGEVNVGGRTVSGVSAGVAATDAVNVSQLNAGVNHAINQANAYTDARIGQMQDDLWTLERGYRGAAASAMAMAGLPQAYLPGKSMLSMSMGGYQGEYGMALGLSGITDNGRWVYKGQLSGNTTSEWGFSVGAGIQW